MKRPDYRTLQALDAVIRERGFERAAQKLCITQSAVSQRIKQLENMFGQPLLVRTVPPRPTEQGQKLLALLRQVELLEEEWLGDDWHCRRREDHRKIVCPQGADRLPRKYFFIRCNLVTSVTFMQPF